MVPEAEPSPELTQHHDYPRGGRWITADLSSWHWELVDFDKVTARGFGNFVDVPCQLVGGIRTEPGAPWIEPAESHDHAHC